ncbi:DUF6456 domain-containing protein [Paracoccus sp. SCSIO 75233]|uniref:DUF6456 domain-containing protein n=1 Tax=Paracoccus sp. SCSIO 75233 TaxID=3017782 RepID=UPI0022F05E66|nr:DUF6456 domain-containing protein [Paracoccus sp. SCSIO 75233]WBU54375.1 DUF6456 domain-containing protein [Paracoccus sp. SCSIO 75233]
MTIQTSAFSVSGQHETGDAERLSADARLYLRHVEHGESIRSLAREAGCHASTMLRRIRRFENRRDDPLIDEALRRIGADPLPRRRDESGKDQTRTMLRRLAERGAELIVATGMDKAIITRDDIRTGVLPRQMAEEFAVNGWVEPISSGQKMQRYKLSGTGRAALRRLSSRNRGLPQSGDFADAAPVDAHSVDGPRAASDDHADQHRIWGTRKLSDPENGEVRNMRVNLAESPLLLLARRKDGNGKPLLTPDLIAAAERLREDFELAHMGPRVTQNWDRFLTAGIDESSAAGFHSGGSDGARKRVSAALRELGPGMDDLVLRVCCFLEGLEMTERRLGWSARSGKVVLKLALQRLAEHYQTRYGNGGPMIG